MEVSYDQYIRNFRMFYNQLIKGHKNEDKMAPQFKQMLEGQTKKWRKIIAMKKDNRNTETATLLNKLKDQKAGKEKSKLSMELLYASTKVQYMIVFGYCYLLLEHKNADALQFLMKQMQTPMANRQLFTQPMLRKVRSLWDKMEQVVSGKRRVIRFEKQLQDAFKDMPQFVMDLLFGIIVNNAKINTQNLQTFMQEITKLLRIKIEYFTISEYENIQFMTYGQEFQLTMRFGQFLKDKVLGYVSRMPEKQEVQVNKQATMECFLGVAQTLESMYVERKNEYMQLSSIANKSKMGKLKRSGSASTGGVESRFTAFTNKANSQKAFEQI